MSSYPKLITVFGGSGFLGRYVVRALAAQGCRVRVACRRPDLAGHLQPLGNVGQIQCVQANLRYKWSIDRAVDGADTVVNLVGIVSETGKQKFDGLQARGADWVAEAASSASASMVQVSAIGADENSTADYARTKALGEKLVFAVCPDATVLRPSFMFGPEDKFFNRFAGLARMSPVMPLIGGGKTMMQPVYVGDVAQAVVRAVNGECATSKTFELGGPEVVSFKQCMERMLSMIGREKSFVTLPFGLAKMIGGIAQYAPGAPLTPGQVEMLKTDNVVSANANDDNRTLPGLDIQPTALSSVLPDYLVRFRKHGQFEANRGL